MTVILGLVFIVWFAIFVLSAVTCDDKPKTRGRTATPRHQPIGHQVEDSERDVSDRHWVAKKQLELLAAAEMSRIADVD